LGLVAVTMLCASVLAAGCGLLEPEKEVTPEEINAAQNIQVVFRNLDPRLSASVSLQYIRNGRLFIDGAVLNNREEPVDNVALRVHAYDTLNRLIATDTPIIYTVPRTLQPGVAGHFSLDLDPTDIVEVILESAD
jgi:hypothetical protein